MSDREPAAPTAPAAVPDPAPAADQATAAVPVDRTTPWGLVRRHWLLAVLLVLGLTLRVLVCLAYRPALLYIDSFTYLGNLEVMDPTLIQPVGYLLVLRVLLPLGTVTVGGLTLVVLVQHALGLAMAVALYALARRLGVPRWLAAVPAAVVLLDGYQLQIEHNVMAETWMQALLVAVLWVLLGWGRPGWKRAALAGLLLGLALITRTISLVVVVPVLCHLLTCVRPSRSGWWRPALLRVGAALAALLVVVGIYGQYYRSFAGTWGVSGAGTHISYGRAASIADCDRLPLDETLRLFCPPEPLEERLGVDWYTHQVYGDPDWPEGLPVGASKSELANRFARTVYLHQPVDLAVAVLGDFVKNFSPVKRTFADDVPIERWQFQTEYPRFYATEQLPELYAERFSDPAPAADPAVAGFLRGYQLSIGSTPGPLLAGAALVAGLAALGVGRARRSGLRTAALLPAATGLTLLLASAAFEFSWRYHLPALVLLPLGGVVGIAALTSRAGRSGAGPLAPFPDPVDTDAFASFERRYGPLAELPARPGGTGAGGRPELVVLIAAYNEQDGLGPVLDDLPTRCHQMAVTPLVVSDGSADRTAEVAAEHGAYVSAPAENRGQGAALRLGYQLAHAMGARYVVSTDADGQYDSHELEQLVAPLLDDTADFVTGSRRLGSEDADSAVRWLGVRVFAWLASRFTGQPITDTSFGFRAMRTEQVVGLRLTEPQYQASELLLSALASGARLRELPMTMRRRNQGRSKKGGNLGYGASYARVMTQTWWREYVAPGSGRRTGRRARTSART